MKFLGLFDKLKVVFDLIANSNILIILVFLIIATIILRLSNKINNKKLGIIICLIELIAFGAVFYAEKSSMINLSNDLIDNIFLNFYFPSIYVYLFIFVFSIVVFIYTLLNKFISNTYRTITNIYFFTFNFIFILLINVIAKNNIDIFAKESLFTNNTTLVLLELSTLLFFLYLVTNTLVYITNYIIVLVENKKIIINKVQRKEEINNLNIEINIEREKESSIPEPLLFDDLVNKLENNNTKTNINLVPEIIKINSQNNILNTPIDLVPEIKTGFKFFEPTLLEEKKTYDKNTIFNGKSNIISVDIIKSQDEKLTLNDYKLFSQMLKTVIQNSGTSNLSTTDILNKNLLYNFSNEEYNKFEKILNSCLN